MVGTNPGAECWEALKWRPSADQLNRLAKLQTLLRGWNDKVNLTRLVEGNDYWVNQIFDSLWPLTSELETPKRPRVCIDVGTGSGFPGLAVAIALPGARMTLVDSVGRKTAAVKAMVSSLGLTDQVSVRTERIEITGHDHLCRGMFDLAMARAVAAAPTVAEYLVPLLQPQGEALIFRGQWSKDDTSKFAKVLKPLRANLKAVQVCRLPAGRGIRHLLRVQPTSPCPSIYPRSVGTPNRTPLGT
ncbi:16S rRNA (guanine(527)-N(7))-methyltransferase RsmG [Synechococcus sp. M16CYN]|uniref:16S rRNA (guanine(527)-N(7))-methyltransferase RsmG n=1 Tax=Synechococcus sp. M16CYN TaxID=3103139 RepID=UPI0032542BB4